MNSQKINVIKQDENGDFLKQVSNLILDGLHRMKDGDFLVIDRQRKGDFFSVFSDALFDYDNGIIIVERFFKREKCKNRGDRVKTFSESDKELLLQFQTFSNSIPKSSILSEQEKKEYEDKINEFVTEISKMKPDITAINAFAYKNYILSEFNNIDDDTLEKMSTLYAALCVNMLTALTWRTITDVSVGVTTIDRDDYIDMVFMPISAKEGEN